MTNTQPPNGPNRGVPPSALIALAMVCAMIVGVVWLVTR